MAGGRVPGRAGGGNPFARAGARQPGALRRPHRLSMADLDAAGRAAACPMNVMHRLSSKPMISCWRQASRSKTCRMQTFTWSKGN